MATRDGQDVRDERNGRNEEQIQSVYVARFSHLSCFTHHGL
jgi:hypothetical protein